MNPTKKFKDERGFVLLVVYVIVIFVSIFSIAFFARHQAAVQAAERYQNQVLAFNAAESGIDFALRELATSLTRRSETANAEYNSQELTLYPSLNSAKSSFSYKISPVSASMRRIDATGCAPNCATARGRQNSGITVYAQLSTPPPSGSLFEYGVYTTGDTMDLSKTSFDSYNSGQGAYGASNVSSAGAIASDSTGIGDIDLSNSTVNGNILVNTGANPNTVVSATNSTITGTKGNLANDWALPAPPTIASLVTPPIELGSCGGMTLAAGTYHCSEIQLSGHERIITTGAVKIYVDGGVQITGQGTTVPNNQPGNLHIYVTGTASVNIQGNGSFYGGIYAPNSDVFFQSSSSGKGGVFFGAVVAKTFTSAGTNKQPAAIHFDLSMKETSEPNPSQENTVGITAWQEMNSLAWGAGA